MAKKSGLSEAFLGLIVLPIAGNACEHITAVVVAIKDKMDLAIGVALGSSIQVMNTPSSLIVTTALCDSSDITAVSMQKSMHNLVSPDHCMFTQPGHDLKTE